MHYYFIYGVNISSEIELYKLEEIPKPTTIDILIHFGTPDSDIIGMINDKINSSMNSSRVWYRNEYGIFIIKNGNEIIIEPSENIPLTDIASFILGWCIAFIFQQRNYSAIHCSCLATNEKAILVSGCSGSGKSTTALKLIEKGYKYLCDDIAMVTPDNSLSIMPAFPCQKICRDVAENIDNEFIQYVDEKKDKFAYFNHADFCDIPQKLDTMFIIEKSDGDSIVFEELKGLKKLNGLMGMLFLYDAYKSLTFPKEEINRCIQIAGQIPIYKIYRPESQNTVEEICNIINNIIIEGGK